MQSLSLPRWIVMSVALVWAAAGPGRLWADNGDAAPDPAENPDTEMTTPSTNTAPEVLVTAWRLPAEQQPLAEYAGHATVVDRDTIESSPSFTMPQLLQQQAGLAALDTVGFGQFGTISMRGYGERSGTLILVDGMRVNDAGDSTAPYLWNSLPLADVERIEVIRGGASTIYGEGAIGGVINIITRPAAAKPVQVNAGGAGGNLGYYSAQIAFSGREGPFDYRVSGNRQAWDGWRDFSGYRGWTAYARPAVDTAAGRFSLSYQYHDETVENPGALTQAEFQANPRQASANKFVFDNCLHRVGLDYSTEFEGGLRLAGKVYGQDYDTTSSSSFGDGLIEQPNIGTTWQAVYTGDVFGLGNAMTVGFEFIRQEFSSTFDSFGTTYLTQADNWTISGFLQDTLSVTEWLDLLAGVRFDHREWDVGVITTPPSPFSPDIRADRRADVWSPKVGAVWKYTDWGASWVTLSRSFRLPSGFDIGAAGSAPGQLFFANAGVKEVRADTIEAGVRGDPCRYLGGSLAFYYSKVTDDILFDPFTFMNDNFDSIRQGVELGLHSTPADWVDFYGTMAWTDAKFDGGPYGGNRLPLVPEWQLTGGINVRPLPGLQLTLETVHARGQVSINDLTNAFPLNEYTVLNTRVAYQWKWLTAFVAVNNLLDDVYQTFPAVSTDFTTFTQVRGFNPAPGINFQAGATVVF